MDPSRMFDRSVGAGEDRGAWAKRFFVAAAASDLLYRAEEGFYFIDALTGPRLLLSPREFADILPTVVETVSIRNTRNGEGTVAESVFLRPDEVGYLFSCPARLRLPKIRCVVRAPVVALFPDGTCGVTTPGLNQFGNHSIYYHVPAGESAIEPRDMISHLQTVFSGVPFAEISYRNNLLAWLLGAVVLDPRLDSPLLCVSGNQQGIGKSETVKAAGIILIGEVPSPIEFRGEEFPKQLGSRFREAERFAVLDNITTSRGMAFDSPLLSRLLTEGFSKKLRVLGHSRSISASGVLFAASLNEARLSTDLSTRSLVVQLFKTVNSPMIPFCRDYALEHRAALYGELLGLALRPVPSASGPPQAATFRFRRWLDFVFPRISPVFGPLNLDASESVDDIVQELFHWGADHSEPFDADFLVSAVEARADRFPSLASRIGSSPSAHGRLVTAGHILGRYHGRTVQLAPSLVVSLLRVADPSDHRAAQYRFEKATI